MIEIIKIEDKYYNFANIIKISFHHGKPNGKIILIDNRNNVHEHMLPNSSIIEAEINFKNALIIGYKIIYLK